jgi:cyclopropane fatty-acyl-phospholipid synthase-like methyltransferase
MNNKINLEEELFCKDYELKTLADLFFYKKAERWVKGFMNYKTEVEHLIRYKFILDFVKNKKVLDIACGCGYGSYIIVKDGNAEKVVGVDLDKDAIRYGNYRYTDDRISRYVNDATTFKSNDLFDVIVSFETIEHIPDYRLLIQNFHENLVNNGILFISTPINYITTTELSNPYHVIEWNFNDFHLLFNETFEIQDIYLQNININKKTIFDKYFYIKKILKKLKLINKDIIGEKFEKYENQYDMTSCVGGYQTLVLKKK